MESVTARKISRRNGKSTVTQMYPTNCHSSVMNSDLDLFGIIVPDKLLNKKKDIETLKLWVKFLKKQGIFTYFIAGRLMFNISKSRELEGKASLLAWQLIRFGLTRPAFCRKVLKMNVKFPSLEPWDCIYLTWNVKPYKNISSYFTPFSSETTFNYVSFDNLVDLVRATSNIYSTIERESAAIPWKIKDIKDSPLKNQMPCFTEYHILKTKRIDGKYFFASTFKKKLDSYRLNYRIDDVYRIQTEEVSEQELKDLINAKED